MARVGNGYGILRRQAKFAMLPTVHDKGVREKGSCYVDLMISYPLFFSLFCGRGRVILQGLICFPCPLFRCLLGCRRKLAGRRTTVCCFFLLFIGPEIKRLGFVQDDMLSAGRVQHLLHTF